MRGDELRGIMGPAFDEATMEQRDRVADAVLSIEARYPDDEETQQAALSVALAVVLGDQTLESVGEHWRSIRAVERRAHAEMTGAILASAGPERELAERVGVTRMTVRKARGK